MMIDSINFFPIALKKLSHMFSIETVKGNFPHLFNKPKNYNYNGKWPDKTYYDLDNLKPDELIEFNKWYDEKKDNIFNFKHEFFKYCDDDVSLLRESVLIFRSLILQFLNIDFLGKPYITLSQLTMQIFKQEFLPEDGLIARISQEGFYHNKNHSKLSDNYLKFLEKKRKINIQKADNMFGEHNIGPYKVDGYYVSKQGYKIALEVNGCYWHPHDNCSLFTWSDDINHPRTGKTIREHKFDEKTKIEFIKKNNYQIEIFRECKINQDERFLKFKKENFFVSQIKPVDAYFGGRTSTFKLRADVSNSSQEIKYFDYNSMYVEILRNSEYPVGYPKVLTNFNSLDISNFYGIIKCDILVNSNLYNPTIPFRYKQRLYFGSCYTCILEKNQESCDHDENERFLRGTWFIGELQQAIEMGQIKILRIFECWHWEKVSNKIFEKFTTFFCGQKINYSGFPKKCDNESKKLEYIKQWDEKGFQLDYDILNKGPNMALKNLFKTCGNSLYGKFGQKSNFVQHTFCYSEQEFFNIVRNETYDILKIRIFPCNTLALVFYRLKTPWVNVKKCPEVNIIVALATSAYGRMKLSKEIIKLGAQILYTDTDSVMFLTSERYLPILGDFLGEFKDEFPDAKILSFASLGPKNYILNYMTKEGILCSYIIAGGFTLNISARKHVHSKSINQIIDDYLDNNQNNIVNFQINNRFLKDTVNFDMYTVNLSRTYKLSLSKRVILRKKLKNDKNTTFIDTKPFGFREITS